MRQGMKCLVMSFIGQVILTNNRVMEETACTHGV
jgi:hypothetical protein